MLQHIVGTSHEGIFLAEHATVLANQGQAVNIGVNHDTEVMTSLTQEVANFAQVFLQGFGVVGKVAGRLYIESGNLRYTKLTEKFGQDDTTYRVYGINSHGEVSATDGININQFKLFHHFNVTLVVAEVFGIATQAVNVSKVKVAAIGQTHHFRSFFGREELTLFVQELQGIPLTGVVRCSDDDTTASTFHGNGQFSGRS